MAGQAVVYVDLLALLQARQPPGVPALRLVRGHRRHGRYAAGSHDLGIVRRAAGSCALRRRAVPQGEQVGGDVLQLLLRQEVKLGMMERGEKSRGCFMCSISQASLALAPDVGEVGPGALGTQDHGVVEDVVPPCETGPMAVSSSRTYWVWQ